MQGEVHLGQGDGDFLLLLAVDRELLGGRALVALDELGALHEHAARAAGGVEHPPVERLDDLDDEAHDGVRGEELAAQPTLGHGEVRQEVLVDEPEGISRELAGERGKQPQQLGQRRLLDPLVAPGEDILQLRVVSLDEAHRRVESGTQVFPLRKVHKVGESGMLRDEQHRPSAVVVGSHRSTDGGLGFQLRSDPFEAELRVGEEDKPQRRVPELSRREPRIRSDLIGGCPQPASDLGEVVSLHHSGLPEPAACAQQRRATGGLRPALGRRIRPASRSRPQCCSIRRVGRSWLLHHRARQRALRPA